MSEILPSLIIASVFTSLSFIYQNWTGIIYLGLLLIAVSFRYSIYKNINNGCRNSFSGSFNTYVFMYTFGYVFLPMFIYNDINVPLLVGFICMFIIDTGMKFYTINQNSMDGNTDDTCLTYPLLIGDFFSGGTLGFLTSGMMINPLKIGHLLFFNEISSSKEMCSMKNKQSFKCAVAKK